MLDTLPIEILDIIIGHLPTASSVINLSLGNRKLHEQISSDKYALLKSFVQNRFPSIQTPPFWRDAAVALTARSRAWDRRAFVARECRLPGDDIFPGTRVPAGLKTGFVPAIDSYETWTGNAWAEKKEVLAWGAAGRLRLRTIRHGTVSWSTYRTPFDHSPQNDIMDVRLLRPHQNRDPHGETVVLRRANNTVIKVASKPKADAFEQMSTFDLDPNSLPIDSIDISGAADPLLAVCNSREVKLYHVESKKPRTKACDVLQLEQHHEYKSRMRCAKFLSPQRLALGAQFLEGRLRAPIEIYLVSPSGLRRTPTHLKDETIGNIIGRHCANAIAPLDAISTFAGRPGDVFLSGWTDGVTRLFDLRMHRGPSMEYHDTVDDGQILSLLPIGHEKFLAGSHHNACLKTFDLRMAGGRAYSYSNRTLPATGGRPVRQSISRSREFYRTHRDINIFLALSVPRARRLWEPLPYRPDPSMPRYRGSVYSLSSPSSSSSTVYAGIESHVIQLDFVSTDDARNNRVNYLGLGLPNEPKSVRPVLNLSCYERPQPGYEIFDALLLRKQVEGHNYWDPSGKNQENISDLDKTSEEGWDERWRLSTYNRTGPDLAWR